MEPKQIEVIVAQYGIANEKGEVMSEQEAESLYDILCQQETMPLDDAGYYVVAARMVGNRKQGKVIAIFQFS